MRVIPGGRAPRSDRLAVVLAGGGARGAYEAGVLRYMLDTLPRRAGESFTPDMLCGTSAGAINAAYVAAGNDCAAALSRHWQTIRVADVYRFGMPELVRAPLRILGNAYRDRPALLDTEPSRAWLREHVAWEAVHRRLDSGALSALVVGTTLVRNGRSIWYVDGPQSGTPVTSGHAAVAYRYARVASEHVQASSAMPLLFPPVTIDGDLMLDGGLRQNTPLSPAVRLGASRVVVVHTQPAFDTGLDVAASGGLGLASLLGKALNALMLDPIDRDLQDLELVNSILDWGREAYGPDHLVALNRIASPHRATPLRPVRALLLRPSEDVGRIAAEVWNDGHVRVGASTRFFLDLVARSEDPDRKELLAYVLFDAAFTGTLEALGHADAMAREEEIARFLQLGERRAPTGASGTG